MGFQRGNVIAVWTRTRGRRSSHMLPPMRVDCADHVSHHVVTAPQRRP